MEPQLDGATAQPGTREVRGLFPRPDCRSYLDTASYGLPPLATVAAVEQALVEWAAGRADWQRDWDRAGDACRPLAGGLLGAAAQEVCLLPSVSVGVATVAASLSSGDEVVVPDDEFRSLLLPLLVAEATRGVRVRRVPFSDLAGSVRDSTTLVATSHVRSNGGGLQDLAAVAEAAKRHGADVLVDSTHAAGVLRIDSAALGLHYVVAAGYKHLLCPRGVAFMRVAPERWGHLQPWNANWRAARDPYGSYYGGSLADLAADAARYDVSLAWHAWVGAQESLRVLSQTDAADREQHCVGMATMVAEGLGLPSTGSSIVGVPVRVSTKDARVALKRAGVAAGFPAGQVRLSFHIYNDRRDAELAVSVLERLREG